MKQLTATSSLAKVWCKFLPNMRSLLAAVLMILTLITFWMEPAEADRLVLAALNLVSHILFLQHLGKILPGNGDQTPLISKNSLLFHIAPALI
jgi:hypothetical protein